MSDSFPHKKTPIYLIPAEPAKRILNFIATPDTGIYRKIE